MRGLPILTCIYTFQLSLIFLSTSNAAWRDAASVDHSVLRMRICSVVPFGWINTNSMEPVSEKYPIRVVYDVQWSPRFHASCFWLVYDVYLILRRLGLLGVSKTTKSPCCMELCFNGVHVFLEDIFTRL